ncbi:MAG: cysteine-rich VLP protein [Clostridia bacterium]|nr:cysteine-rich VLP protein [Clostridia bacterium]
MNDSHRELTNREIARIGKLVVSRCANYDEEYGCLPLDGTCYMLGICYTNSPLCKYFRDAVLPTAPALYALFQKASLASCRQCGKRFHANGRRAYCSDACATAARRRQTAARVRRHRQRKSGEM